MRLSFYIYCALCAAGTYVSSLLLDVHATAKAGGGDTGICARGAGVSCADAAESAFGEIFGMPVAALGFAFYLTALILVIFKQFMGRVDRFGFNDVFLAGGVLSAIYSLILAGASAVVIGKWCPLCITLYGINFALLITAIYSHAQGIKGLVTLLKLPKQSGFWFALCLLLSMLPFSNLIYASKADEALKFAKATKTTNGKDAQEVTKVNEGSSPSQGAKNTPIVVVEFSDFECPYCQRLALARKSAQKKRPDLFRYVFKHYPMDNSCNRDIQTPMHKNACSAALAMTCAGEVGKAWDLHDVLFANQEALEAKDLVTYAAYVGIDPERFTVCMSSPAAMQKVKEDINEAIRLGVEGTPTWYMNGIKQVGVRSPEELIAMFEQVHRDEKRDLLKTD